MHSYRQANYRISSVIRQSFSFFQNNPKDLDPSCKTDLDLLDCLRRVNLVLLLNFIGLIYLFVILEGKNLSYSWINTVMVLGVPLLKHSRVLTHYAGLYYESAIDFLNRHEISATMKHTKVNACW